MFSTSVTMHVDMGPHFVWSTCLSL